ncbi:MAG: DNA topoisomerase [Lachnospiraceae bacterium]
MLKSIYIAEKPSVAREFAKALKINMTNRDGYLESDEAIVTWCVGHLITMSYPEVYDENLKRWSLDTLPFIPEEFRYEIIPGVKKQFTIVKDLLNRPDVDTIYVCTDSGREGEYIYRLVRQESHVQGKTEKRVWIDSQTEEEILRGIREAKDLSEYDNLAASAYLRAKEDYLMGINFSRALTLKYGYAIRQHLNRDKNVVIAVGRVMTCVLGMIVEREREIRNFVKTTFYRVQVQVHPTDSELGFTAEWKCVEGSDYYGLPILYKDTGFLKEEDANRFIDEQKKAEPLQAVVQSVERKTEKKNPPLLYNLAELQNECSRFFKISPDATLSIVQELYEKKLVTYPRTDARVLSTAVSKEIWKNLKGLCSYVPLSDVTHTILQEGTYKNLAKTRYVNDKQITDHYAIIPTGQGLNALNQVSDLARNVYQIIVRRFLCIFLPPAQYQKASIVLSIGKEQYFANFKVLSAEGYLLVANHGFGRNKKEENDDEKCDAAMLESLKVLRKGSILAIDKFSTKEGETTPPKRYTSGSMILAMENAGQLIEDEELRALMKGSGIGTSATRAEIIKKIVNNGYVQLNNKTQVLSPKEIGELIYDVVCVSIRSLLNPKLTASWEKGLTMMAEGTITEEEYMQKLSRFIQTNTDTVKKAGNPMYDTNLHQRFVYTSSNYHK